VIVGGGTLGLTAVVVLDGEGGADAIGVAEPGDCDATPEAGGDVTG
jgi:hypothetical protein